MPAYKVGISSGFWNIGKDPNLLGLAQKAGGFGATGGIQFNQVDMETISEFQEPRLKENMKKVVKDLGIQVGLHGEIGETSGFESAIRKTWEQVHFRLVTTVKNAAELGFIYVNYHLSTNLQVQQEEDRLKAFGHQYQVVSPNGTPLAEYIRDKPQTKEFSSRHIINPSFSIDSETRDRYRKEMEENARREIAREVDRFKNSDDFRKTKDAYDESVKSGRISQEEASQRIAVVIENYEREVARAKMNEVYQKLGLDREERGGDPELIFKMWGESQFGKYFVNFGEIGAYWLIGRYMMEAGDPLWANVVKSNTVQDAYNSEPKEFNEAVKKLVQKKQKDIEVKKLIELTCLHENGILRIKKVLEVINENVKITYLAAGKFQITIKSENYKKANQEMDALLMKIEEISKKTECEYEIKEK